MKTNLKDLQKQLNKNLNGDIIIEGAEDIEEVAENTIGFGCWISISVYLMDITSEYDWSKEEYDYGFKNWDKLNKLINEKIASVIDSDYSLVIDKYIDEEDYSELEDLGEEYDGYVKLNVVATLTMKNGGEWEW